MLKEISWSSYWLFIATTLVLYYCTLFAIYKLKTKLALLKTAKQVWRKQEQQTENFTVQASASADAIAQDDFLYPSVESAEYPVYACVDEVNAFLEEARKHKGDKDGLISALRHIVAKYPSINRSEYQVSLSNVMVAQCAHLCFIDLSDADMERVWQG
ncbi:hypothetical protein SAMN05444008_105204 [Cnuella takakiae]|uniref:Uncharacterized protein n=1 Tax=Cnuella takakiae TaxID=1302690 RepID=A0A1M4ZFE7_9BACT|nr:hypothetical protein [Cnuella takakiae]OLY94226.1 hypothetical protein BUE76_21815 [Cnuella takakiae]SHF16731.1 hypothetical protein SAMN05444008_105204 [Cnuella takakiae]